MHWRKKEETDLKKDAGELPLTALKAKLKALSPKQYLPVTYEAFSEAFPPGEEDTHAREPAAVTQPFIDPATLSDIYCSTSVGVPVAAHS